MSMNIYPIYHSGVFVEIEGVYLLFDYYKGNIPLLDANKPLYCFISHGHYDHYCSDILSKVSYYRDVKVICANGVNDSFIQVNVHQRVTLDEIEINTLDSTDEGVAFLVKVGNYSIYHAGDLHAWLWDEEDTLAEKEEMLNKYIKEISLLPKKIDVAFAVLDPRQCEDEAVVGIKLLNDIVSPKCIIPMHYSFDETKFDRYYSLVNKSIPLIDPRKEKIIL